MKWRNIVETLSGSINLPASPEIGKKSYPNDKVFRNLEDYEDNMKKYLTLVSSPKAERNMELVKKSGDKKGSEIARETDHYLTPNHAGVLRNKFVNKEILNEQKSMTPLTEEVLNTFKQYEQLYNEELGFDEEFKTLLDSSKSKGGREIYRHYDENESFTGYDIVEKSGYSRSTYHQYVLPYMEEAGLLEWEEQSLNAKVTTKPPYGFVKEFLGALESIIQEYE